jgi:L-ascorbate metabolism protein UlaG (beta-lactamase superfamily)
MTERPLLWLAADPARPVAETGQVTFIGTATTVLQIPGFTILTDPNFLHHSDRPYRGLGITTRRLTEPAIPVEQLPGLHFIVLPHHHGDHFDRIAARRLDHNLPVITEPHTAEADLPGFRRPIALSTWEAQTVERGDHEVTVTSVADLSTGIRYLARGDSYHFPLPSPGLKPQ